MDWIIWGFVVCVMLIFVGAAWLASADSPRSDDAISDLNPSWHDPTDNKGAK